MKTVLCFGDSNTHGTKPMRGWSDSGRFGFDERWTGHVRKALGPDVHLIEEGHPGRTTVHDDPVEGEDRNAMRVLSALLQSHRPIDILVMMLGTNDTKNRFCANEADVARGIDRLIGVVERAAAGPDGGRPKMLIVSPVHVVETGVLSGIFRGGAAKSAALAPAIAEVASDHGARFLDAAKITEVPPIDGVHLDAEGHAKLGGAIAAIVAEMLE